MVSKTASFRMTLASSSTSALAERVSQSGALCWVQFEQFFCSPCKEKKNLHSNVGIKDQTEAIALFGVKNVSFAIPNGNLGHSVSLYWG